MHAPAHELISTEEPFSTDYLHHAMRQLSLLIWPRYVARTRATKTDESSSIECPRFLFTRTHRTWLAVVRQRLQRCGTR